MICSDEVYELLLKYHTVKVLTEAMQATIEHRDRQVRAVKTYEEASEILDNTNRLLGHLAEARRILLMEERND